LACLVHKKSFWEESEAAAIFCIVHGFDFEDSKAFVYPCGYRASWRFIAFAYADRSIGYIGRVARTSTASNSAIDPATSIGTDKKHIVDVFIAFFL
jgi:hypothetical protein